MARAKYGISVLFLLACVYTIRPQTSEWVYVTRTDEFKIYYSPKRLKRLSDSIVRSWSKWSYTSPGKDKVVERMNLDDWDCREEKRRTISSRAYDKDGNSISAIGEDPEWQYVVPGSVADRVLQTVCK